MKKFLKTDIFRRKTQENPKADLVEIFSSFQGEGLFIGAKQIFVRFAECNLSCSYCDTSKDALLKAVTVAEVVEKIKDLEMNFGSHHAISLTGGEPLLHVKFLYHLLRELKRRNFRTYLETNGTLTRELKQIIKDIDIIAMDIKLPSSTGMPSLWKRHMEFLRIARRRHVFIKVVITEDSSAADMIKARDIVGDVDRDMLFILQPASAKENGEFLVDKEKILAFRELSKERLNNVRIIPQLHKFMGIK